MSHTYALMEISKAAFDEIAAKLKEFGYEHAFDENGAVIDMHGIGLTMEEHTTEDLITECNAAFDPWFKGYAPTAPEYLDDCVKDAFRACWQLRQRVIEELKATLTAASAKLEAIYAAEPVASIQWGGLTGNEIEEHELFENRITLERINNEQNGSGIKEHLIIQPARTEP